VNYPYLVAIGLLMVGLYTMIAQRNLVKKLVGMTVFQTAIILFFLLLSVKRDGTLPIVEAGRLDPAGYMNPLPHVLMLTAIVVAVATSGRPEAAASIRVRPKVSECAGLTHSPLRFTARR